MARQPNVSWDKTRKGWYTTAIGEPRATKSGKVYRAKVWNFVIPKGDRKGAVAWLDARLAELRAGVAAVVVRSDPTFDDLSETYLAAVERDGTLSAESLSRTTEALIRFGNWPSPAHPNRMDARKARSIDVEDMRRFATDLIDRGLSEAYVCGSLVRSVKACYSWGSRVRPGEYPGLPLASNPVAAYKPPRVPRRAVRPATAAQVDAFLGWNRRRLAKMKRGSAAKRFAKVAHLLLMTIRATGCRPKELCSAEWPEWSARPDGWGVVRLPWRKWKNGAKTRQDRVILVPPECTRRVERLRADPLRHPTHLFVHRSTQGRGGEGGAGEGDGTPSPGGPPSGVPWVADYRKGDTKLLQAWFRRLRNLAIDQGVDLPPKFRLYWLRSLYSTEAQLKGSNKAVLARNMGTSERMLDSSYTDMLLEDALEQAKELHRTPSVRASSSGDASS